MTSLCLALAALLLVAAIFIFWPLWRYRNAIPNTINSEEINIRLAENVRIFREHLIELENSRAEQAIDTEQFDQLKLELERNLLEDEASLRALHKKSSRFFGVKIVIVFFALVLFGGIAFYQKHGSVSDVKIQELQQEKMKLDYQDLLQNRDPDPARTKGIIEEYKARLKTKPDNVQYWFLLARAQMELSDFGAATEAYQQVLERDPQSPMIMAELAQAMFLRDGNKITPPAAELARSAVTLDPKNTMALGLVGIDAFTKKDYREAIRSWQKAVELMGANSEGSAALVAGIERAKQEYKNAGGNMDELNAKSAYAVSFTVSLGDKAKVAQDDIVFIYARAWKGSPMPLAISRVRVADLPKEVTLDETMAMSPMASLSNATDIEIIARVSKEGTAKAKVGDWQAKQGPISMKSIPQNLQLNINEQVTADSLPAQ